MGRNNTSRGKKSDTKPRWWRTHQEAAALLEEFPFGPLVGANQKQLAEAVCAVWSMRPDRRALQRLAADGDLLVVKADAHHHCQIFFRHQSHFDEAATRLKFGTKTPPGTTTDEVAHTGATSAESNK